MNAAAFLRERASETFQEIKMRLGILVSERSAQTDHPQFEISHGSPLSFTRIPAGDNKLTGDQGQSREDEALTDHGLSCTFFGVDTEPCICSQAESGLLWASQLGRQVQRWCLNVSPDNKVDADLFWCSRGGRCSQHHKSSRYLGTLKQNEQHVIFKFQRASQNQLSVIDRSKSQSDSEVQTSHQRSLNNKCEFSLWGTKLQEHTQFLTTFLWFLTASAPSQSMTYLKILLFAFQSKQASPGMWVNQNPTNQWRRTAPSLSAQQDSSDKKKTPEDWSTHRYGAKTCERK